MYTMFNGRVSLIRHKFFVRSCSKNTQIISQKQKQKKCNNGNDLGLLFFTKKERKLTYLPQAIFPSLVIRFVQTGLVNAKFLCLLPF